MTDLTPIKPPPRPQAPKPGPRKKVKVKARKGGNTAAMLGAIGALVLVAGFMMWRRTSTTPTELPAKPTPGEAPAIIESPKQLKQMQAEGQRRTDILVAERAAGLQTLPLQNGKDRPTLKVQVKSMARGCAPGDWDIIRQDQQWLAAKKPQLVLSLEDLSGAGKSQQRAVTVDELRQGLTLEFPVELPKERRLLGLFLCSTHDDKKCQNQSRPALTELSQLQTTIADQLREPSQYPGEDKTFFFHLIVAYPDRLLLHDAGQTLESSQTRLQAALDKGGKPVGAGVLQDAMERTRSAGSLPGVVLSNALQILLPHRGEQCQ